MEISISLDPAVNKNLEEYLGQMNDVLLSISKGRLSFHADVFDGEMVERKAINIDEWKFISETAKFPIDLHLTILRPQENIEKYLTAPRANVRSITFHVEVVQADEAVELLTKIKAAGFEAGVALNIGTSVKSAQKLIERADVVTLMSNVSGKSGQPFMPEVLPKVQQVKKINHAARVIIDIGVTRENIASLKDAGVDTAVVGSYIYKAEDRKAAVLELIHAPL